MPFEVEAFPNEWQEWQILIENEPVRRFSEFARPGEALSDVQTR